MSPFRRHAAGIFSANALNNLAALGITLAAARLMPLDAFGTAGLAMALIVVVATLTDWGLNVSLVRAAGRTPALATAAAAFVHAWKRVLLLLLVAFALVVPQRWLEPWPALDRVLLATTLLSAGLLGCWMSRRALEQARENFTALRRATMACAVLRVLAFALAVFADIVTPVVVLACLYVLPLSGLLALTRPAPTASRAQVLAAGRALLGYCGWVGAGTLCFVVFTRAPLLVLAGRGADADLGLFTGALTFTLGFAMLAEAMRTVALPRILRAGDVHERDAVRAWLRQQTRPVLALATAALLALVILYELLLGRAHTGGALLLLVMGLGTLAAAGVGLQNALVHAQARPRLEAALNLGRLLAFGALAALLPATPAALAVSHTLVLVSGELVLYALVRRADARPPPAITAMPRPPLEPPLAGPQPLVQP